MITEGTVTKVHKIYETHLARWRYYYASFNGGFDYRKSSLEMLRRYLNEDTQPCLLYTSPSPRDQRGSRMPSSA